MSIILLSYDDLEAMAEEQEREDRRWRLRNWRRRRRPICPFRRRHSRYHYWIRETGIPELPICVRRGEQVDPASLRYRIAGREYKIGTRVQTPEGPATVTALDPGEDHDIGVTLDSTGELVWTTWRYAEPQP